MNLPWFSRERGEGITSRIRTAFASAPMYPRRAEVRRVSVGCPWGLAGAVRSKGICSGDTSNDTMREGGRETACVSAVSLFD